MGGNPSWQATLISAAQQVQPPFNPYPQQHGAHQQM